MKTLIIATTTTLLSAFVGNAFASTWTNFTTENSPLPAEHVTAICHIENGTWIGTDGGLAFYDGTNWNIYNTKSSDLPNNYVYDIEQDDAGNIWVATAEGLLQITDNNWNVFNTSNSSIPIDLIRSVTIDPDGNPWIGTWGGGIASLINGQWTTYNTTNSGLNSNGVFTVESDSFGKIWIGSFNGGVSIFNGQDWVNENTSNSELPNNHVRSITFDNNGVVWLGTDAGLARKTADGIWDIYTFSNTGHSFNTVLDGVMESPEKLHFATDGGILQFDHGTFNIIKFQNSDLSSNNTRCIALGRDSGLWVGTGFAGLNIYDIQNSVGITESYANQTTLVIYPNPVTQEVIFSLGDQKPNGPVNIQVVNMIGQTLISKTVSNLSIHQQRLNVSQLPSGTYQLIVRFEDGISSRKFILM